MTSLWDDGKRQPEKGCSKGLLLLKIPEKGVVFYPLTCGRNDCKVCLKRKGRKAYHRVMAHANGPGRDKTPWAITVTFRGSPSMYRASRCWNRLRLALSRRGMEDYFRAREFQKRGSRHEHVLLWGNGKLTRAWPTEKRAVRWLKDTVPKYGYGFIADAQKPNDIGHVGVYCAKYLSKTIDGMDWQTGERLFSFSRSIPPLESGAEFIDAWHKLDDLPRDWRKIAESCIIQRNPNRWVYLAQHLNERRSEDGVAIG